MTTRAYGFTGADGSQLSGRLDEAEGPALATAIFAHCFTCGKDSRAARQISRHLTGLGFNVLRFDFTGLGQSEGEFADSTFSGNVADLVVAAQSLAADGMEPTLMIGHSLGGAAVLRAAGQVDSVKGVVTIGAPFDPSHVIHNFEENLDEITSKGRAEVDLGGRPFTIGKEFVDDVRQAGLKDAIGKLHRALLVLHAPLDRVVGIENAAEIFTAAKHPKSFVTLDDADHLLTRLEDAEYAAEVIASWASRYLELEPPAPPPGAPEGIVRSTEADPNGFLQYISAGPAHRALADEPKSFGGTDLGMSPYGFLSAGLAACTSMTIRMYARRKKLALDNVWVDVSHDKSHPQDAEQQSGKVDVFSRVVHLEGDLDEAERKMLLAVADRCPVHRTLEAQAHITTELA